PGLVIQPEHRQQYRARGEPQVALTNRAPRVDSTGPLPHHIDLNRPGQHPRAPRVPGPGAGPGAGAPAGARTRPARHPPPTPAPVNTRQDNLRRYPLMTPSSPSAPGTSPNGPRTVTEHAGPAHHPPRRAAEAAAAAVGKQLDKGGQRPQSRRMDIRIQ